MAVLVVDGVGHGEGDEVVWETVAGAVRHEVLFHLREGGVVLVGGIVALDIEDCVVGGETGERVNVGIGIVAGEVAVVDPQDAVGAERVAETVFNLSAREVAVAVGGEEAFGGGEYRAAAVAFDGASFEHEAETVVERGAEHAGAGELGSDEVVEVCGEFQSPPVETEVDEADAVVAVDHCYGTEIACPRVVGGYLTEEYARAVDVGQIFFRNTDVGCYHYQYGAAVGDGACYVAVAACDIVEHVGPVGVGVRPCY